ncbi:MAG: hypothetical protein U5R31_17795 [Acidimicrobiia bacterium]|nr:hypothetical protein [Acidimicrobiia bacterium]
MTDTTDHRAPVPRSADDLTPGWLTAALAGSALLGSGRVAEVTATPVGTGQMCESLRLHLTLAEGDDGDEAPTLVAKIPADDDTSRSTAALLRSYEIEVRFYQQLARQLGIRTPAVYHADIDLGTTDFVLLLEDLAPAEPGDQVRGCSVQEARRAVSELVGLHAPRWDDPQLADIEWLHRDPEGLKGFLRTMLPTFWEGFRARYTDRIGDEVVAAADRLVGEARHLSRTRVGAEGGRSRRLPPRQPALPSRRGPGRGRRLADRRPRLAAHRPRVLRRRRTAPEDRREVEEDLLRHYHQQLTAAGVTDYPLERCREDYRWGTWSGLVMAISASMVVEQTDRGDEMFLTMAHRHATHVHDLDATTLLA